MCKENLAFAKPLAKMKALVAFILITLIFHYVVILSSWKLSV